jgi:SpoIID/LytB domain protein
MYFKGVYSFPNSDERLLLVFNNKIVEGYFHSTCGGFLSGPEVFWDNRESFPYFRRDSDAQFMKNDHCANSPHYRWKTVMSKQMLEKILGFPPIRTVEPEYKQNRIARLKFNFKENFNPESVNIQTFLSKTGKHLGWNVIKSNSFQILDLGDSINFDGRGLGHGIGMCQWGGWEMAKEGRTFREILQFYYPNTELAVAEYE